MIGIAYVICIKIRYYKLVESIPKTRLVIFHLIQANNLLKIIKLKKLDPLLIKITAKQRKILLALNSNAL